MITSRTKNNDRKLSQVLERERLLTKEQLQDTQRRAKSEDRSLAELLFEDAAVSSDRLLELLGAHYRLPTVLLRGKVITPYVLNLIPKEVAERHDVVVFKKIQNVIHVATTNPHNHQAIEFIRRHTKLEPEVFLTTPDDLRHALTRYRTDLSEEFGRLIEDSVRETETSRESVADLAQHLPIITMVNTVIERALAQAASDVHIAPGPESVNIRFRVDGIMRQIVSLPKALHAPIEARIKLMANLKIDEHRTPQDGRFSLSWNNREVAVRVSIVPTLHGSKVVLRLLDAKQQQFSLRSLGLNQSDYTLLKNEANKPHGMILVTGPTGSGKTTTLYALLRKLNTDEVNICTIEDPIEYGLPGVSQTQINPSAKLTFANGLRSLLRQDPNVIMVGEIRDAETADMAVNAAMTGHLVLSTLHTNSAPQTVQRLLEMGVQPYLAASTINIIIAQRLVRKVCRFCRREVRLIDKTNVSLREELHLEEAFAKFVRLKLLPPGTFEQLRVVVGRGCERCQDTGYLGRIAIYELLSMTEETRATIVHNPSPKTIAAEMERQGRLTMAEDGLHKVFSGVTTIEEVIRVTK